MRLSTASSAAILKPWPSPYDRIPDSGLGLLSFLGVDVEVFLDAGEAEHAPAKAARLHHRPVTALAGRAGIPVITFVAVHRGGQIQQAAGGAGVLGAFHVDEIGGGARCVPHETARRPPC